MCKCIVLLIVYLILALTSHILQHNKNTVHRSRAELKYLNLVWVFLFKKSIFRVY